MKKLIETSKILDAKRMPGYKFLIINYLNFIEDLNCSLMVLQCTILNSCLSSPLKSPVAFGSSAKQHPVSTLKQLRY
jgi:hypothetical protein